MYGPASNSAKITTISLFMLSAAAISWADNAPSKPATPTLTDILANSGITATGYVSATYSYFGFSGSYLSSPSTQSAAASDYNTFLFQQAGLTIALQPSSGFGALIDVVATPYSSIYVNNYAPDPNYYLSSGSKPGAPTFAVLQGFAQYASGPWTVIAGKFPTLAGAEVYAPTGNVNVTRSILYTEEPVTHTGVRATYAASSTFSVILGVNNGWFNGGGETSVGSNKTIEAGISFIPNKTWSWTLQNYYGRDLNLYGTTSGLELLDTVLTWNATSALSLVGTADYGNVGSTTNSPSASWWGAGAYINYQFSPKWRASLRGEYFDDQDGYLTDAAYVSPPSSLLASAGAEKLKEVTLTLGFDPIKNFELRLEGRYDDPDRVTPAGTNTAVAVYSKTTQGWLEALFHF